MSWPQNPSTETFRSEIRQRFMIFEQCGLIKGLIMNCGAKTRAGAPCLKPALVGRKRCRLHGGLFLTGSDHPNFQHGRCSKRARADAVAMTAYLKVLK